MYIALNVWRHAGNLESLKEVQELFEAIAKSNFSFLSALHTFQVHT